jgi:hypothetical protein
LISLSILLVFSITGAMAQDSDAKFLSAPEFILSEEAVAAGIDGTYKATLGIDASGNVTSVRLYGDPAWPCETSPERELKAVRAAVEDHLRLVKFTPAMKNGKPRASDVMLDFAIGEAFKRAVNSEEAKKSSGPRIVKGGVMNGRAISLAKPFNSGAKGIANVQVLIDEQGRVTKAGVQQGHPLLFKNSREAACESKFSPTLIGGKPVRVTGVITYIYR